MIDWILGHWFGLIAGGLVVRLWTVARDRRKAVDRFNEILRLSNSSADNIKVRQHITEQVKAAGLNLGNSQDAPGRVIARSVKRVTEKTR
jgi:hypothetical protein